MNLVLDSNALSRLARRDPGVLAKLEAAQRAGGAVYVPTVCLVESLTATAADAALNQRLKRARKVDLAEPLARDAAKLRAAIAGNDAADPVVVATAATLAATVVSTDPDIAQLASHCTPPVRVVG